MKLRTAVAAIAALVASVCVQIQPAGAEQNPLQLSEDSSTFATLHGGKPTLDSVFKFELNPALRALASNSYGSSCSAIASPYPYQWCVDATQRTISVYTQPVGGGAFSWRAAFTINPDGTLNQQGISDGSITGNKLAVGAAVQNIGFTPVQSVAGRGGIVTLGFSDIGGSLACSQRPALTGAVTASSGSCATAIAAGAVTSDKIATGAAVGNIGFTPMNPANNGTDLASITSFRRNVGLGNVPISIESFGVVASSTGAAAANSAAIQSAMAASTRVSCADGATYYAQDIVVPSTLKEWRGGCSILAAGTLTTALVRADNSNTNLTIEGLTINATGYASKPTLYTAGQTNLTVKNVSLNGGQYGIIDINSANTIVESATVSGYSGRGIYFQNAAKSTASRNKVFGTGSSSAGIIFEGGTDASAGFNYVSGTGGFGISFSGSAAFSPLVIFAAVGNRVENTILEGIQVDNSKRGSVAFNKVIHDPSSTDFGMSLFGNPSTSPQGAVEDVAVFGNIINSSCKASLALASNVTRVTVTGNYMISPNTCLSATDPFSRSAIIVYGSGATGNSIGGNTVVSGAGPMDYMVSEINDPSSGTPDYTFVGQNFGLPGALASVKLLGAHSTRGNPCTYAAGAGTC